MVEKPTSGDEEQRREQTRAARAQSGLPPEQPASGPAAEDEPAQEDVEGGTDVAERDH